MTNKRTTYLVDSSIYIFRAWFSMSDGITDRDGNPANAIYGFCTFVMQLLRETGVSRVVFTFDVSLEQSFRNQIYPSYKANRDPAPEELKVQFQHCIDFISALGFPVLSDTAYEADDLIGSLAMQERNQGRSIVVVTGDKDLVQVVAEGDYWWDYAKQTKLDSDGIYQKFGVYPEQMADMLAIAGDPVDNIPGVQGIGAVTAVQLLKHFGSFDNLFEDLSKVGQLNIRGARRIEALLAEFRETARLSRRLTKIYCDASLPDSIEPIAPDLEQLESLMHRFGFSTGRTRQWLDFAQALHHAR